MPDPKKTKATKGKTAPPSTKKATAAPARTRAAAPAAKATAKPAAKPAVKVAAKPAVKVAAKPAVKVAAKASAKPAVKHAAKSATARARAATPAPKAAGAVARQRPAAAKRARPAAARKPARGAQAAGTDPAGFFVARVRGEEAVREAPHQMLEAGGFDEEPATPPVYDEGLGELPWSYGDDALIALPRDPRTLFLYWDHAQATLAGAFEGMDHPRAQIWLFVRGAGWERIRVVDFALESRGYYLHDLEPGRVYRAEIHVVDRRGQDRLLPQPSNPMMLPQHGPSPVVDDRFVRIPWDLPLPRLLGAGVPGGPFSEELRALLARLSDWSRLLEGRAGEPGAPGGGGAARPTSRGAGFGPPAARPGSPSSPFGPFGGEGR